MRRTGPRTLSDEGPDEPRVVSRTVRRCGGTHRDPRGRKERETKGVGDSDGRSGRKGVHVVPLGVHGSQVSRGRSQTVYPRRALTALGHSDRIKDVNEKDRSGVGPG